MEQNHLLDKPLRERSPENTVVTLYKNTDGGEQVFRCFAPIASEGSITCNGQHFVKMRTLVYAEYRYRCIPCGQVYISKERLEPLRG
jgi:hypothetical protein